MNQSTNIRNHRGSDLVSRVQEDVTFLRKDLENLISHAARHSVPDRIHELGARVRKQPPALYLGGAALVGLLAAGSWMLFKHNGHDQQS